MHQLGDGTHDRENAARTPSSRGHAWHQALNPRTERLLRPRVIQSYESGLRDFQKLAQLAFENANYRRAADGFRVLLETIGMTAGGTRYRYLSASPDLLAACVGALSSEMPMTSDDFFRRLREEWDIVVSPSAATGTTLAGNLDGDELTINLRRFERLLIESGLASGLSDRDSACRRARSEERLMSDRLAVALIEHIRLIDATAKFLVIEAVPMPLARSLEAHWDADDPELPRLAVATPDDAESIGEHGLRDASVATLRNRSPRGSA